VKPGENAHLRLQAASGGLVRHTSYTGALERSYLWLINIESVHEIVPMSRVRAEHPTRY
jgi:hypothetical protein